MKKTNQYPIILVHGFLCWGSESKINQFLPLFGMWNGNAKVAVLEEGIQCYTPQVGPFSGLWDRACVLYAKIKGGRVDFGKAHSEKYGHARYGETYKGLVPNWGELDDAGKLQKISLVGHSFGGPTVRMLIHMLAEGSAEERAATPANELNPLFVGGKEKWIHSCTTLAATHGGVTLPDAGRPLVNPMAYAIYGIGNIVSGTPIAKLYNFDLDRFGITGTKKHIKLNKAGISKLVHMEEDNIFYELSIEGGEKLTKSFKTYDNIYYFSYAGKRTRRHLGFLELPTKDMWLPLRLFSLFECLYKDKEHGKDWQPNDGLVNVPAALSPKNEPSLDFVSKESCKPGVWHVMPLEWKDHTSYMGVGETHEDYQQYFKDIADRVTDLPVVE